MQPEPEEQGTKSSGPLIWYLNSTENVSLGTHGEKLCLATSHSLLLPINTCHKQH